ncbi:MAG: hypothetical protein ACYC7H_09790 [Chloroflexota bacterium]
MGGTGRIVDYSLRGLVTIRLVNATASAEAELEYLLGPSQGQPAAEPDIRINFDANLGGREHLRFVGLNEAAFDQEDFYLLNHGGRRATFACDRLGDPITFNCEPGASVFPYLLSVVGLRLLAKGYVMLHAASLVHEGRGILVTGWQKGGKTEMLLAYMAAGAQYLADEWTILSPGEGKMWGVPGTLQVWDWHLRSLPQYWRRIRPRERTRLRLLRLYQRLFRLVPAGWHGRGAAGQWLHRLSLDGGNARWGQSRSAPVLLFGKNVRSVAAPVDLVFLAGVGHAVSVGPVPADEVARRMVASLAFERRSLTTLYQHFRYAFPERRSELLETAGQREGEYLRQAFQGKPAYEVLHPYPVPLNSLFEATLPIVRLEASVGYDRSGVKAKGIDSS